MYRIDSMRVSIGPLVAITGTNAISLVLGTARKDAQLDCVL